MPTGPPQNRRPMPTGPLVCTQQPSCHIQEEEEEKIYEKANLIFFILAVNGVNSTSIQDDAQWIGRVNDCESKASAEQTQSGDPIGPDSDLGPLPGNWEMAYTSEGEVYFIE